MRTVPHLQPARVCRNHHRCNRLSGIVRRSKDLLICREPIRNRTCQSGFVNRSPLISHLRHLRRLHFGQLQEGTPGGPTNASYTPQSGSIRPTRDIFCLVMTLQEEGRVPIPQFRMEFRRLRSGGAPPLPSTRAVSVRYWCIAPKCSRP